MTRKSVQGGYCIPDGLCALENESCANPTNFQSSEQMQGAPVRAHGGSCLLQESVRSTILGICGDGNCSPNAASCTSGGDLFASSSESLSSDKKCEVAEILFGKCGPSRCAWSPEDCDGDESWLFPGKDCSCDKVQVGGCQKGYDGEVFCAVSPDACDTEQSWIRPTDVFGMAGYDCFLCRELSTTTDIVEPAVATTSELVPEITSEVEFDQGNSVTKSTDSRRFGFIVGLNIGAIVVVSILGYTVYSIRKMRRNRPVEIAKSTVKKPAASVNTDEEEDDISVL